MADPIVPSTDEPRCDLCGTADCKSWFRWPDGEPCHGLRRTCGPCHARVRAASERVLANVHRLSLGVAEELGHRLEQGPPGGVLRHQDARALRWAMPQRGPGASGHPDLDAIQAIARDEVNGTTTIGLAELDGLVNELRAARDSLTAWPLLSDEDLAALRKVAERYANGAAGNAAAVYDDGGDPDLDRGVIRARRLATLLAGFAQAGRDPDGGTLRVADSLGCANTVPEILRTIERVRADRDRHHRHMQAQQSKIDQLEAAARGPWVMPSPAVRHQLMELRQAVRDMLDRAAHNGNGGSMAYDGCPAWIAALDRVIGDTAAAPMELAEAQRARPDLGAVALERRARTNEDTERNLGKLIQERTALQRQLAEAPALAVAAFVDEHAARLAGEAWEEMDADSRTEVAAAVHHVLNHLQMDEDGDVHDWRPEVVRSAAAAVAEAANKERDMLRYAGPWMELPAEVRATRVAMARHVATRLVQRVGWELDAEAHKIDRVMGEMLVWLRHPVPDAPAGYPAGFLESLCDAVCALNLACEDDPAALDQVACGSAPAEIAAAIFKLREVAYPMCPGCSEACGNAVHHYPPLCVEDPRTGWPRPEQPDPVLERLIAAARRLPQPVLAELAERMDLAAALGEVPLSGPSLVRAVAGQPQVMLQRWRIAHPEVSDVDGVTRTTELPVGQYEIGDKVEVVWDQAMGLPSGTWTLVEPQGDPFPATVPEH